MKGGGCLTYAGANSYSGNTTINNGTLVIGNIDNVYASNTTTINSGGTLTLVSNNGVMDNWRINTRLSGNGTINISGTGWIQTNTNSYNFNGTINVLSGATFGTSTTASNWAGLASATFNVYGLLDARGQTISVGTLNGNGTVGSTWNTLSTLNFSNGSFSGLILGNGAAAANNRNTPYAGVLNIVKTGTDTLTLLGNNTYSGTTTVSGTIQAGNGGVSGTLGSGAIINNGLLVFNTSSTVTVAGAISGSGGITQAGTGVTVLTGSESYSGSTTILVGVLQAGNGAVVAGLSSASPLFNIAANGTLSLNYSGLTANSVLQAFFNKVSGAGKVRLYSSGINGNTNNGGTWWGTGNFSNNFTGTLQLVRGRIDVNGAASLGAISNVEVSSGGQILFFPGGGVVNQNFSIAGTGWGEVGYPGVIRHATNAALTLTGNIVMTGDSTIYTQPGVLSPLTLGGVISGNYNLTIQDSAGAGIIFSGNNTYSGTTTIAAGILQIGNGVNSGNLTSTSIINSGTLVYNVSGSVSYGGVISCSGSLLQKGSGTLILTGNNTYTGTSTIMASATLQVGNNGSSGTLGTGAVSNNGTLSLLRSDNYSISTVISSSSGVSGSGNFTATAAAGRTLTLNRPIAQGGYITLTADQMVFGTSTIGSAGVLTLQTAQASTTIGLGGGAGTLSLTAALFNGASRVFQNNFSSIVIGGSNGTGAITVNNIVFTDPVTLRSLSGSISLNGTLDSWNSGNNGLSLITGGIVNTADSLLVGDLALSGGGAFLLNSVTNQIQGILNANNSSGNGSITVLNSANLTVGTVNSAGTLFMGSVSGNITVNGAISTSNSSLAVSSNSGNSAITLNAGINISAGSGTGGNLILTANTSFTTGGGGNVRLYSVNVAGSTGLLAQAGSANIRFNSDEVNSNFNTALSSGVHVIFRQTATTTVTASNLGVVYGNTPLLGHTLSSSVSGYTPLSLSVNPTYAVSNVTLSTSGHYIVGNYTINISGGSIGDGSSLSYTAGTLTVTPKIITASYSAADKVYDATVSVGVSGNSNGLSGDLVTVSESRAAFSDKHAGSNKSVTVNGIVLQGSDSGNYMLSSNTASTSASITPALLTVSELSASDRVYNGGTEAVVSAAGAVFSGLYSGDEVLLTALSGSFADRHAGSNKSVSLSASYGGADVSNYLISSQDSTSASITPLSLNILFTGNDKVYDGTDVANVSISSNILTGDQVSLGYDARFLAGTVGENITITLGNITFSGVNSANYNNVPLSAVTSANITPVPLTITANSSTVSFTGIPFSGGSGVRYSGFITGEDSSVLSGGLIYSGSSQGAVNAGSYLISASGLSSLNYDITYIDGTLVILNPVFTTGFTKASVAGVTTIATVSLYPGNRIGPSRSFAASSQGNPLLGINGVLSSMSDNTVIRSSAVGGRENGTQVGQQGVFDTSNQGQVLMMTDSSGEISGMMMVMMQASESGTGRVQLPIDQFRSIMGTAATRSSLLLSGGGAVPTWLEFDWQRLQIGVSQQAPAGALPLSVELHIGNKIVPITIGNENPDRKKRMAKDR